MKNKKMKKSLLWLVMIVAVCIVTVFTLGGSKAASAEEAVGKEELVTVKYAVLPFLDHSPWYVGVKKGWFEEVGINLETQVFSEDNLVYEALINGSIDAGACSDTSSILAASRYPDFRYVAFTFIFHGHAMISRPGILKTYDDFLKEYNGDHDKAIIAACKQLKGKEVVTTGGTSVDPVLDIALEFGELSREDIKLIDMEPEDGAAAFISGIGDVYMAGIPMRVHLVKEGYPIFADGLSLGGQAMVLGGVTTSSQYLQENEDTILKILSVWYRIIDYMYTDPDDCFSLMLEYLESVSTVRMTVPEARELAENLDYFVKFEDAKETFYSPESIYYCNQRYMDLIDYWVNMGKIKRGAFSVSDVVVAPTLFEKLLKMEIK